MVEISAPSTANAGVKMTPLPAGQIFSVAMINFCETVNINVLFPFLAFMVEDMGHGGASLGYYAGGLAAAFCGAQFCSSIMWGWFSDSYGRKPAVILGTLGAAVGIVTFGTAKSYWQAVAGRMLSGFLSGNLGVAKSFLTEITDDSNRGKGFSYFSLAWAVGTVVAPLCGGMLCKPADKYPHYFSQDGLFGYYPYLLPCLFCVACNLVGSLLCFVYMKETRWLKRPHHNHSPSSQSHSRGYKTHSLLGAATSKTDTTDSQIELTTYNPVRSTSSPINVTADTPETAPETDPTSDEGAGLITDSSEKSLEERSSGSPNKGHSSPRGLLSKVGTFLQSSTAATKTTDQRKRRSSRSGADKGTYSAVASGEETGSDSENDEVVLVMSGTTSEAEELSYYDRHPVTPSSDSGSGPSEEGGIVADRELDAAERGEEGAAETEEPEEMCFDRGCFACNCRTDTAKQLASPDKKVTTPGAVMLQRKVVLVTSNYGILAMAYILLEETIPLFLKLDAAQGGFSFNSMQIGFLLSTSGGVMLFFTFFFLPAIANRSKYWLFHFGALAGIPLAFAWPFIALLNYNTLSRMSDKRMETGLLWTLLISTSVVKSVVACITFTAVTIQINHSVADEHLGAANGLGQSMAALTRAIGPAVGGMLWSLSIEHNFVFFNFIAVGLILCVTIAINQQLSTSLDVKKNHKPHRALPDDAVQ